MYAYMYVIVCVKVIRRVPRQQERRKGCYVKMLSRAIYVIAPAVLMFFISPKKSAQRETKAEVKARKGRNFIIRQHGSINQEYKKLIKANY